MCIVKVRKDGCNRGQLTWNAILRSNSILGLGYILWGSCHKLLRVLELSWHAVCRVHYCNNSLYWLPLLLLIPVVLNTLRNQVLNGLVVLKVICEHLIRLNLLRVNAKGL